MELRKINIECIDINVLGEKSGGKRYKQTIVSCFRQSVSVDNAYKGALWPVFGSHLPWKS